MEKQSGADSLTLTLTLDFLIPKSIGINTVSSTATVPSFKSCDQGFYHVNSRIHIAAHTHTHIQHDKVIAMSAPPAIINCFVTTVANKRKHFFETVFTSDPINTN